MFTVEAKSQLAKLLATENIRIEHKKIHTAAFDPKNRVLYCPIWKDMTGAMYDLLMGHEVGHALYTPADGWHDAACSNGKKFKAFLNVIEDARIEKKVKRKYPGLRPSFVKAYKQLMDQDFFGVADKDINKLSFINRLNLYTKSDYTLSVQFNAKEKMLVDRVRSTETWQDVLDITGEVWKYSVEEQQENDFEWNFDSPFGEDDEIQIDSDDSDDFGDESEGQDGNNSTSSSGDSDEDGEEQGQSKSSGSGTENDGEENEGEQSIINRDKETQDSFEPFEPSCETDEIYRKNESALLDEKSKDYLYLKFPKPNLKEIVTPVKRVQEQLTNHYNEKAWSQTIDTAVAEFKKRNERYISLLAKEFEMKKAAKRFSKAKVSNTGDIDISRLYKYKVDDNIFRKAMKVPNGKSHGLVMLFDRSGSMFQNLRGTIEQMLIVTMFCRKVNIPFTVYGFGNSHKGRQCDTNNFGSETLTKGCFSTDENELVTSSVFLREYLNSKMSNSEFSKSLRNMVALMESYPSGRSSRGQFWYPNSEDLSNTPMNEALIALEPITNDFRKVNNLDIVNTVLLHDGDSDWTRSFYCDKVGDNGRRFTSGYECRFTNVYIVDDKTKKEYKMNDERDLQKIAMKIYQKRTNSKIFGFYITSSSGGGELKYVIREHYFDENGKPIDVYKDFDKMKTMVTKMKKEKLIISHKDGYEKFFLIPGGKSLAVDEEEIEVEGKITTNKLTTAFKKFNAKRQVNRVLVSQFIEGIATE